MGSDVDLALEGASLTLSTLLRMKSDLEESNLPYFFNLIDLKTVDSSELIQHIKLHGIVIYPCTSELNELVGIGKVSFDAIGGGETFMKEERTSWD
jgi:hypothetical protein